MIDQIPAPADPPFAVDERETLVTFLDYYRAVLIRKAVGLSREFLRGPDTFDVMSIACGHYDQIICSMIV